jgi:hypothetical protein
MPDWRPRIITLRCDSGVMMEAIRALTISWGHPRKPAGGVLAESYPQPQLCMQCRVIGVAFRPRLYLPIC